MPHRLQELRPRHHAAIRMRLDGRTTEQICDELGITPRTLYIWFSDPLIKAELRSAQRELNRLVAEKLALAASSAVDALPETVETPPEEPVTHSLRLQAIRLILERVPVDLAVLCEPSKEEEFLSLFDQMTSEQLDQFLQAATAEILGVTEDQARMLIGGQRQIVARSG